MAVCTCTGNHTRMVHRRASKSSGALMAGLAGRCGLDMSSWLAFGGTAVMTIGTTRNNTGMVHGRTGKRAGALMTGLAGRCGLDMVSWLA